MAKYLGTPSQTASLTISEPGRLINRQSSAFQDAQLVKQLNLASDTFSQAESLSTHAQNALVRFQNSLVDFEVRQIKSEAIATSVWDFYPTPRHVIEKMLEFAQLESHHRVLEPSAGSGDLVKAIANTRISLIDCFEIHPLLRQTLTLQRFNLIGHDFLLAKPNPVYDRVIANPPFGSNGVANHTIHAYSFLKPGGRLITIAHHYKLRPSECDRYFFNWLASKKARFLNLGSAFKDGERSTKTPVQLILITKPI